MPGVKVLAAARMLTETLEAGPPELRVPLEGETLIQVDVLERAQLNELLPVLVMVKEAGFGVKGPPGAPLAFRTAGVTRKSSGRSKASCKPVVVELAGEVALRPMPRLAKAAQSAARFAPPLSTR